MTARAGRDIFTINHCEPKKHLTGFLSSKDNILKVFETAPLRYEVNISTFCIKIIVKKKTQVLGQTGLHKQCRPRLNAATGLCLLCLPLFNIGIKHGFSCINIRQVPWEVLKTEAEGRGFQHLPRDLANVNALKNHVRSLLLHKN